MLRCWGVLHLSCSLVQDALCTLTHDNLTTTHCTSLSSRRLTHLASPPALLTARGTSTLPAAGPRGSGCGQMRPHWALQSCIILFPDELYDGRNGKRAYSCTPYLDNPFTYSCKAGFEAKSS